MNLFFGSLSTAGKMSLTYITIGALTMIWTIVWSVYLLNNLPAEPTVWYWCGGFFVTGLVFVVIGLGVGQINKAAEPRVVTPPQDATVGTVQPATNVIVDAKTPDTHSPIIVASANDAVARV